MTTATSPHDVTAIRDTRLEPIRAKIDRGERLTLDGFVAESRSRLRESGVVGEPEISLHNSADCEPAAQP